MRCFLLSAIIALTPQTEQTISNLVFDPGTDDCMFLPVTFHSSPFESAWLTIIPDKNHTNPFRSDLVTITSTKEPLVKKLKDGTWQITFPKKEQP